MRLSIPTPPEWTRQQTRRGEVLRAPDGSLEVVVMPMVPAKLAPAGWIYSNLAHDPPEPGAKPENIRNGQVKTSYGWLAVVAEADLGSDARFVAYFTLLDMCATVVATRKGADFEGWRDLVINLLYRATPDVSAQPVPSMDKLLGRAPPTEREVPPAAEYQWKRTFSGGDAVLVLRSAPDAGWIRCTPRRTPLRSAAELLQPLVDDSWTPHKVGITAEGEYYAIATARKDNTQRVMALVFGDESYTCIESVAIQPDKFGIFEAATRRFAYETSLGYGQSRVRPFYHRGPEGWYPIVRPGVTVWVAPTCARQYWVVRVYDARQPNMHVAVSERRFESMADEFLVEPPKGPAVFYRETDDLECRLSVYSGDFGGGRLKIFDGALLDEEYCYPVRLECDAPLDEASMEIYEGVVKSIVPLPRAMKTASAGAAAFSNYVE